MKAKLHALLASGTIGLFPKPKSPNCSIFVLMLIFLDIDGVLVPAAGWKTPENMEDGFPMFTEKSTKALQELISKDTTLVLSSSHRDRFSIDGWKKIFKVRGLNVSKFQRLPPSQYLRKRKEELMDWFNANPVKEGFVIIDDDTNLNALPINLKEHLVLTSPLIGLTPDHVPEVEAILGRG